MIIGKMTHTITQRNSLYTSHSIKNFRQLCGGRYSRHNSFYRCGFLSSLSVTDINALNRLGIKIIIDLRDKTENNIQGQNIRYMHFPINNNASEWRIKIPSCENYALYYAETLAECSSSIAEFFSLLSEVQEACPLLYGCRLGKDRTGIISFLLLKILFAEDEDIYSDYEISTNYLLTDKDVRDFFLAKQKTDYMARCETNRKTLKIFQALIREKYGCVSEFLQLIGISLEKQKAIIQLWGK